MTPTLILLSVLDPRNRCSLSRFSASPQNKYSPLPYSLVPTGNITCNQPTSFPESLCCPPRQSQHYEDGGRMFHQNISVYRKKNKHGIKTHKSVCLDIILLINMHHSKALHSTAMSDTDRSGHKSECIHNPLLKYTSTLPYPCAVCVQVHEPCCRPAFLPVSSGTPTSCCCYCYCCSC